MKTKALYPLRFNPILKSTIWGGEQIAKYKRLTTSQDHIGESWEISGVEGDESIVTSGIFAGRTITEMLDSHGREILGEANFERFGTEFPLLIKFIDARDDLSIQVHPDDELAAARHNSKGKTEMWYVVGADESARLRSGFAEQVTPEEYVESVENSTICDKLKEYDVIKGDLFFLPAGRIHSIGAGCFIAEIQQTSNITYRIYDFNRVDKDGKERELHTELAKGAIDYTVLDDYKTSYDKTATDRRVDLIESAYFTTSLYNITESMNIDYSDLDSFVIYICLEGDATLLCDDNRVEIAQGESILLPATISNVNVISNKSCKLLSTYIS